MTSPDDYPFEPHRDLQDLPSVNTALNRLIVQSRKQRASAGNGTTSSQLTALAHRLLTIGAAEPWAPARVWWERLDDNYSWSVQEKTAKELATRQFVEPAEVRLGRANVLLLWLTELGYLHLGIRPPERSGRGGVAHRFISNWIVLDAADGRVPVIGVGGVENANRAQELLDAGCAAVQLYTALVYEGPGLPHRINVELASSQVA